MKGVVVALLRHADYEQPADVPSAHLPYPLTAEGIVQAKQGASQLLDLIREQNLKISPVIECSRMLRAWQTASLIAEYFEAAGISVTLTEFDALAERSVGAAANLTVAQIEQILANDPRYEQPAGNWKSTSDFRLPFQGAESLSEAGARVAAHLEHAADGCTDGELKIVVGHGASMRHAAAHLGVLSRDEVGLYSMYHAAPVLIARVDGRWLQVAGEWKLRQRPEDSDEYRHG